MRIFYVNNWMFFFSFVSFSLSLDLYRNLNQNSYSIRWGFYEKTIKISALFGCAVCRITFIIESNLISESFGPNHWNENKYDMFLATAEWIRKKGVYHLWIIIWYIRIKFLNHKQNSTSSLSESIYFRHIITRIFSLFQSIRFRQNI